MIFFFPFGSMLITSSGSYFRIKLQIQRMGLTSEDLEPPADDPEYEPDEGSTSKGEKRKSFKELGPEMKKLRIKPLLENVEEWAEEETEDVDDTIARLGMNHANAEGDRDKAKIYRQILDGQNPFKNQELTVKEAVALKVNCSLFTFCSAVCLQF